MCNIVSKKWILLFVGFFILFFIIFYLFQNNKLTKENIMEQNLKPLELHFWERGREDFLKYSYENIDRHPVGMNFMDIRWQAPQLGIVKIITESSDLIIPNTLWVGGIDYARMGSGIQNITIRGSLHYDEYTTPENAYKAYVTLAKQINQKHWKQYFQDTVPRIHIEDNFKYALNTGEIIDPTYILSYEEWREVLNKNYGIGFELYNNEITLSLFISRRYQDDKKEQYSTRYEFVTFRYLAHNGNKEEGMSNEAFKDVLKNQKINYDTIRDKREIEVIKEGYRINKEYVYPDIWQYAK